MPSPPGGGGGGQYCWYEMGAIPPLAGAASAPLASLPRRRWQCFWHKASAVGCLPLAAPIGLSPLLILTLCGSERVLVVCVLLLGRGGRALKKSTPPPFCPKSAEKQP